MLCSVVYCCGFGDSSDETNRIDDSTLLPDEEHTALLAKNPRYKRYGTAISSVVEESSDVDEEKSTPPTPPRVMSGKINAVKDDVRDGAAKIKGASLEGQDNEKHGARDKLGGDSSRYMDED